jgi:hypothetical protein
MAELLTPNTWESFMTESRTAHFSLAVVCNLLLACSGVDTASPVDAPGRPESTRTQMLEAGAATLQSKPPIDAINAYLDGFHFYNGHQKVQMEAHHYCSILNEDVIQCVIYDGNVKDAKIMGVEYIIDGKLLANLPAAEKAIGTVMVMKFRPDNLSRRVFLPWLSTP